jgi:hypothetical protein
MRLTHFGAYAFPDYDSEDPLDTAPTPRALVALPGGGAFDAVGAHSAPGQVRRFRKRFTVLEPSLAALDTSLDLIRALNGKRDLLWALMEDNTARWTYAACEGVSYSRRRGVLSQVVEMAFVLPTPGWGGPYNGVVRPALGVAFDAGCWQTVQLTSHPQTVVLTNNGNKAVTAVQIKFVVPAMLPPGHAGNLLQAQFVIHDQTDLTMTKPAGHDGTFLIDCGAKAFTINGVDHYSALSFGVTQRPDWFALQPGANDLVIEVLTSITPEQLAEGVEEYLPSISILYCDMWE